jgi:hypothetical protein
MPCRERFDAVDFAGVIGADLFRRFVVESRSRVARAFACTDPASWQAPSGRVQHRLSLPPRASRSCRLAVALAIRRAHRARPATRHRREAGA